MERNMECPGCHGLSFLGEWQTPKETQNMATKMCENCKKDISTVYLVQPKEKKKGMNICFMKCKRKMNETI